MLAFFIVSAVGLVVFAGLLAAADAALAVTSRADLVDLAATGRSRLSLLAVGNDVTSHIIAITFMRVVAETLAAVLVTLALVSSVDTWWLALLLATIIMTLTSFVLVGSSPRSVGREHSRAVLRFSAPAIRGIRLALGPIPAGRDGEPQSAAYGVEHRGPRARGSIV